MNIKDKHSLQFELWPQCNQKCIFCYNSNNNDYTPDNLKEEALDNAYDFLCDKEKIKNYNVVSLIGGEFFQGQLNTKIIHDKFFKLIKKISELQLENHIKEVWIMATLAIGNQNDLYNMLEMLNDIYKKNNKNDLIEQLWIVTSYDTIGRFHTQKMHDTWSKHMKKLHELYPLLHLNTSMILTQDLIKKYINDEFSFHDFYNEYKTEMFFKQPSPGAVQPIHKNLSQIEQYMEAKQLMEMKLPGFFPKREDFLKFLIKFKSDCPDLYDKLFNIVYRADDLYRNFDDKNRMQLNHRNKKTRNELDDDSKKRLEEKTAECGHQINYCAYIDSNECVICDREFIRERF